MSSTTHDETPGERLLDLIYLDAERAISVLSQLRGRVALGGETLVSGREVVETGAGADLRILNLRRAKTKGSEAAERETWSIGHKLLHECEAELRTRNLLFDATAALRNAPPVIPRPWYDEFVYNELHPGRFFTLTAPVTLIDYGAAIKGFRRIVGLGQAAETLQASQTRRPQRRRGTTSSPKVDWKALQRMVEGLEGVLEERVLIRVFPLSQSTDEHHLVGPLKSGSLADSADALHAKYGFTLVDGITVVGQVANRPQRPLDGEDADASVETDGEDLGLEAAVEATLALQPQFSSTARWPLVTFTPLGIYRSVRTVVGD